MALFALAAAALVRGAASHEHSLTALASGANSGLGDHDWLRAPSGGEEEVGQSVRLVHALHSLQDEALHVLGGRTHEAKFAKEKPEQEVIQKRILEYKEQEKASLKADKSVKVSQDARSAMTLGASSSGGITTEQVQAMLSPILAQPCCCKKRREP